MKVYTKKGDGGQTQMLFGARVSKSDPRCEAVGAADTAGSAMGLARALCKDVRVKEILLRVQREMFTVGAELATSPAEWSRLRARFSVVSASMVTDLEEMIDELDPQTGSPQAFIVPGGSAGSGALDLARSLLRAGERRAVALNDAGILKNAEVLRYMNRLSDLLFVLGRFEDRESPPELATGGQA